MPLKLNLNIMMVAEKKLLRLTIVATTKKAIESMNDNVGVRQQ